MAVFRRAEFEERVERVRRRALLRITLAIMILAFGYPTVLALHTYGVLASPIHWWLVVPIVGFALAWGLSWMVLPRLIRRLGLTCPVCGKDLWSTTLGRPGRYAVLESGKCPKCGTELLDAAEAGARPQVETLRDHIEALTLIALMLIGLAAFVYFGKKSRVRSRIDACARRYAAATTAADSLRVDQSGFRGSGSVCGYYKR